MKLQEEQTIAQIQSYIQMIEKNHKDKSEAADLISRYEGIRKKWLEQREWPNISELELLLTDLQEFVERAEGITK